MPLSNQATLHALLKHLKNVAKQRNFNRMKETNLSLIFGPTLMTPPLHLMASQMQRGMSKQTDVLDALFA